MLYNNIPLFVYNDNGMKKVILGRTIYHENSVHIPVDNEVKYLEDSVLLYGIHKDITVSVDRDTVKLVRDYNQDEFYMIISSYNDITPIKVLKGSEYEIIARAKDVKFKGRNIDDIIIRVNKFPFVVRTYGLYPEVTIALDHERIRTIMDKKIYSFVKDLDLNLFTIDQNLNFNEDEWVEI